LTEGRSHHISDMGTLLRHSVTRALRGSAAKNTVWRNDWLQWPRLVQKWSTSMITTTTISLLYIRASQKCEWWYARV